MLRMIEGRFNHPCIIMWVLFNEGWGLHRLGELTEIACGWDPSRRINHESGEGLHQSTARLFFLGGEARAQRNDLDSTDRRGK